MPFPATLRSFLRNLFSSRRVETDLSEEVHSHFELLIEQNVRAGMSPNEAKRAAQLELGGVEQLKEQVREVQMANWFRTIISDARYGLRQLRQHPAFTAVAVLTLAVGIGANTAIFSVVDAVLLRPLPFKNPERLVAVHEGLPKLGYPKMAFSPPDLAIFAREQKSFSEFGAYQDKDVNISGHGEPERVTAARIGSALFPMLGIEPMLGRTFSPEEEQVGHNVVLLSYGLWQRRYGAQPNILGQTINIDRQPYTVVGVLQPNFEFPLNGPDENGKPAELWVPLALTPQEMEEWGGLYFTSVLGRLRPGVTVQQARAESESLARVIVAGYPAEILKVIRDAQLEVIVSPFQEEVVGSVRTLLLVLMAAVAFVLLIACANIATLLVSRATTRQKEIAVRTALGATRLRLIAQLLTESVLLGLGGGALGLLLAFAARGLILSRVPSSIPLPHHVPLHAGVFAFAFGISIGTAVLFGLAPAFQVSSASVQRPLQEGGRSATPSHSQHRLQGIFVAVEFALAFVLLIGAGLLIRSFGKLLQTNPGFRAGGVLTMNIPLPREAYAGQAQIRNFYINVLHRVSNLPGGQSAAISNDLPLHGHEMVAFALEGKTNGATETPKAICQSWVMGNYLETMGIPLLQGRWFTPLDRLESQTVAVVNVTAARKFWPGQDPIGKRLRWGVNGPWQTVIGMVGDVSEGPLNTPVVPHVYRPYTQAEGGLLEHDPFNDLRAMNVAIRTQTNPASLTSAALNEIHALDPDLAVTNIQTMTQVVSSSFEAPQFNVALLGALAALALFLSAIGVYGVLAHIVAQQTHEIGVRMALGAKPGDILRLILSRGARLSAIGAVFGFAAALALTRLMKGLLYNVSAIDRLTFIGVAALLALVALLASYIPARRATRVDPMIALRYE